MDEITVTTNDTAEMMLEEVDFLSRKLLDLNKQLIESEKAKTRFLSLVANELNNPMTALLGLIPHLSKEPNDQKQKILGMVEEEALRLDFHIQNLVAAAEIESGEIKMSYALINPEELIDEVLKSLKYQILANSITIHVDNKLQQKVVTDPQKLHLILKNLIANGCIYGNEGTSVDVIIDSPSVNELTIAVKNIGKGPSVEYKPQVYTRFSHGPEGIHGLGIGLSIVRELSEKLNGNVDYETKDRSVTFTVTLPLESKLPDSQACGSNEFLFESFDDAFEL